MSNFWGPIFQQRSLQREVVAFGSTGGEDDFFVIGSEQVCQLRAGILDGGLAGVSDADVESKLLGHKAKDGGPV